METIPKNTCTKIGFIQKPHGIHGELIVLFQEQFYDSLEQSTIIFLEIENLLVPFFITKEGIRFRTGDSAIIKLDWIDSEEQAKELNGINVFIKNKNLKLDADSLNVNTLEGYLIIDQRKTQIGTINTIDNFSGNIVFNVNYLGKEIMIPFNEDFLIKLDTENKTISLNLPDGLLHLDDN